MAWPVLSSRTCAPSDVLTSDIEALVIQLGVTTPVYVVTCYRPPDRDADIAILSDLLAKVRLTGRPLIVTGDFNIPEIAWQGDDPGLTKRSTRAVQFLDMVDACGLEQSDSVLTPTRGGATLDLVLSCGGDIETDVRQGTFDSDHRETVSRFLVHIPRMPAVSRTRAYNYRRADFDGLRAVLRSVPWTSVLDSDVDSATELFYNLVQAAVADHVPVIACDHRFPPWFARDVRCALRL